MIGVLGRMHRCYIIDALPNEILSRIGSSRARLALDSRQRLPPLRLEEHLPSNTGSVVQLSHHSTRLSKYLSMSLDSCVSSPEWSWAMSGAQDFPT